MITRQKKRTNRNRLIVPILALLVFGYFGSQAYQGEYGIRSQVHLQEKIGKLELRLARTTMIRQELESRVTLLRDGSIEKDMLDEQVRRNLGYVLENDLVILR